MSLNLPGEKNVVRRRNLIKSDNHLKKALKMVTSLTTEEIW